MMADMKTIVPFNVSPRVPTLWAFFVLSMLLIVTVPDVYAQSGGFAGGATPSRFEVSAEPGEVLRRSLKIYNLGNRPARFQVATADWTYSEDGKLGFSEVLMPASCRPWVRLESHEIEVVPDPGRPRPFRFEVHVPADAAVQECRFALMIGSSESTHTAEFDQTGISLPVTGRLGVIVYVAIGGAQPKLVLEGVQLRELNGRQVPTLKVSNNGLAHGRLDADLIGTEPSGKNRPLSLATSPILAGQTRYMAINGNADGGPLIYPLTISGRIYGPSETYQLETVLQAGE